MTKILQPTRCLFTGSNGKLGLLLRRAWRVMPGPAPVWMARRAAADILWSPGQPVPPLPAMGTVIALWGCTTGEATDLADNVNLVPHAIALAEACGARTILHFSSAAVYGPGADLDETTPPAPANAYGASKLAMEEAIRALPRNGIRHCTLRIANVVGADNLAQALARQDAPVTLDRFADGHGPLRSYIAPGDLARVLAALAALPADALPDCLNVTAPAPVRMEDIARAAGRPVVWRDAPDSANQTVTMDATKLAHLFSEMKFHKTAQLLVANWRNLEFAQ